MLQKTLGALVQVLKLSLEDFFSRLRFRNFGENFEVEFGNFVPLGLGISSYKMF